jgi:hypothetical protein
VTKVLSLAIREDIFLWTSWEFFSVTILNFKSSRWWLLALFLRAAKAPVWSSSLELGGVGISYSEDLRTFPIWAKYQLH